MTRRLLVVLGMAISAAGTPSCASMALRESDQRVSLDAYAEFASGDFLIVEGQRIACGDDTVFRGSYARSLEAIALGNEVKVKGVRLADGSVRALEVEVKPNGDALFEAETLSVTNDLEDLWVKKGMMFEPGDADDDDSEVVGELLTEGPAFERVLRITRRLLPSYLDESAIRVYLVDTEEWNAAAMGNGAIWVYLGLVEAMSDDELAVVIGHELAHVTHEHSRRSAKADMWSELLGAGVSLAAEAIDNDSLKSAIQVAAAVATVTSLSKYSRGHEDQADRVGLRYVHEAGFDVTAGPKVWKRFQDKYGDENRVLNFFLGSHSRSADRIRNMEAELKRNYQ
jgi:Zn-dependent protease with chaperone function